MAEFADDLGVQAGQFISAKNPPLAKEAINWGGLGKMLGGALLGAGGYAGAQAIHNHDWAGTGRNIRNALRQPLQAADRWLGYDDPAPKPAMRLNAAGLDRMNQEMPMNPAITDMLQKQQQGVNKMIPKPAAPKPAGPQVVNSDPYANRFRYYHY